MPEAAGGAPAGGAPGGAPGGAAGGAGDQGAQGGNAQGGNAGAFDWKSGGIADADLGYVQQKGWKGPQDLFQSYRGLEKLMGAPQDQIIRLPQGDAITDQQWNESVYDRLGRPKTDAEYKLPTPEGQSDEYAKQAAKWFHEVGLSQRQAERLAAKSNEFQKGLMEQSKAQTAQRTQEQVTKLKAEWGGAYEANAGIVDRAATAFGMTTENLAALKGAMGADGAMKFLHNIGTRIGTEDGAPFNNDHKPGFGAGMSVEAAKSEIAALKADKGWVEKYANGDLASKNQMSKLLQIVSPGTQSF